MLSVFNLSKSYGDQLLFSGMTFNVGSRDRIAVIGPNGSGKTTLFEIITGNVDPDSGSISRRKDITIGYARQEIIPDSQERLLEHVCRSSTRIAGLEHRIQVLQAALADKDEDEAADELLRQLGELQHRYEASGGYNVEHDAQVILCGLGFKPMDYLRPLSEFSGGWLMRVMLAKLLLLNPDLLLLDEPTNHLDLESCIWFEDYLKSYQGAVMVTSHDRAFLNRVAKKIIAIERDDVIFYHGSYDEFVEARKQDQVILEATAKRQEQRIKKEMRFIERFRYKATKAAQVQSRIKAVAKIERVVMPRNTERIHFNFPEPVRSGEEVIKLVNIQKSYNGIYVYNNLNLSLKRNDRVALVGPNGSGKTTLLKIMAGVLPFENGERKPGYNVTTAYYAQYQLELLNPQNNVLEELRSVAQDEPEQRLRALLGAFLFSGDDVFKKVSVLSGGEKSRLSIAKMLVRPANFLLMDEPTNHLDINSREMLTDALDAYHGTLCFITHDRTVIREIANKIVEIRQGEPLVYEGTYDEYLDWKERSSQPEMPAQFSRKNAVSAETSARDIQRQRKFEEGELRNNYFKISSPLKKRIAEIESELAVLEKEFQDLEQYFAT
ncbi:MAG TPA: ABC-F family ATP-binding cassette domain-containing protein, partial [Dehalococcoidales bacterium]|nr:ABC-F family ATP-binding cassette domain-containing protein [Dehalococcoidales bacterium]